METIVESNKKAYADFSIETLLSSSDSWGKVRFKSSLNYEQSDTDKFENDECDRNFPNEAETNDHRQDIPEEKNPTADGQRKGNFAWLSCTRFKPPKLTRSRKKISSKRNGRGPRIPFSTHQLAVLEKTFTDSQYLSGDGISKIANDLHLTETRVKIWFQNRRARYRREKNSSMQSLLPFQFEKRKTPTSSRSSSSSSEKADIISRQSFRHLINDLNLMAASATNQNDMLLPRYSTSTFNLSQHRPVPVFPIAPNFEQITLNNFLE